MKPGKSKLETMRSRRAEQLMRVECQPMHSALESALSTGKLASQAMAIYIATQAKSQGIEWSQEEVMWLEEQFRKRAEGEDGLTWDHPLPEIARENESLNRTEFERIDFTGFSTVFEAGVSAAAQEGMESFYELTLEDVREQLEEAVVRRASDIREFRNRVVVSWQRPLQLLASLIESPRDSWRLFGLSQTTAAVF